MDDEREKIITQILELQSTLDRKSFIVEDPLSYFNNSIKKNYSLILFSFNHSSNTLLLTILESRHFALLDAFLLFSSAHWSFNLMVFFFSSANSQFRIEHSLELANRVDTVKNENTKLQSENQVLIWHFGAIVFIYCSRPKNSYSYI